MKVATLVFALFVTCFGVRLSVLPLRGPALGEASMPNLRPRPTASVMSPGPGERSGF